MEPLVAGAREALRMPALGPEGAAIRATQGQLRQGQQGAVTDRELCAWAHRTIGHDGPLVLQELVDTDDVLDVLEFTDATPDSVHRDLQEIASRLLDLPDPSE